MLTNVDPKASISPTISGHSTRSRNWTTREKDQLLKLVLEIMPHKTRRGNAWREVCQRLPDPEEPVDGKWTLPQVKQQWRDLRKRYDRIRAANATANRELANNPTAPHKPHRKIFELRHCMEAILAKELVFSDTLVIRIQPHRERSAPAAYHRSAHSPSSPALSRMAAFDIPRPMVAVKSGRIGRPTSWSCDVYPFSSVHSVPWFLKPLNTHSLHHNHNPSHRHRHYLVANGRADPARMGRPIHPSKAPPMHTVPALYAPSPQRLHAVYNIRRVPLQFQSSLGFKRSSLCPY
ncbi:hypothetical protein BJ085DRAFT_40437 [Dimargaris cristalligena]|uniref:Myb-like domain-containing protein n=1 Tax=Dimargaris cristalligena TaxID=215637 RepID=A0A4Q0A481_9FUNG|nr:hypothetical protein BJ085DRAFT_40437 [Dimargaris cristalligena]|eukprot:RKP40381.1 hypothetical protein BJ085DRAFT_40437 [Dimargaris cristalligena]